jgi:hypothetical protein
LNILKIKKKEELYMNRTFEISRSKKGLPVMWQRGGGATNTGRCTIICGSNFEPLKALYIRRSGSLSNSEHSLHIISEGYHIIVCTHHRRDFAIGVYEIKTISADSAEAKMICEFSEGQWDSVGEELFAHNTNFRNAIEAAMKKAVCYHCRSPHYIVED